MQTPYSGPQGTSAGLSRPATSKDSRQAALLASLAAWHQGLAAHAQYQVEATQSAAEAQAKEAEAEAKAKATS